MIQPQVSPKSNELFNKLKTKQLKKLFDKFDGDHDGLISADKVEVDFLSEAEISLLFPLLEEIEARKEPLDFQGFYKQMNRLLSKMNVQERALILK